MRSIVILSSVEMVLASLLFTLLLAALLSFLMFVTVQIQQTLNGVATIPVEMLMKDKTRVIS